MNNFIDLNSQNFLQRLVNHIALIYIIIQVAWLCPEEKLTWEPSSNLPKELIDEFHKGIPSNKTSDLKSSYGAINHALIMKASAGTTPKAKKMKRDNTAEYNFQ